MDAVPEFLPEFHVELSGVPSKQKLYSKKSASVELQNPTFLDALSVISLEKLPEMQREQS